MVAATTSSALSAAITFKVQRKVLENLRAALVFADRQYAESGEFDKGTDTLVFVNVPDLALTTTPLTEGTAPTRRALTIGTVAVSAAQYGDAVSVTDVAKVKSPIELVEIGSERLGRQAKESLDQISRDVIALGGTAAYHSGATLGTRVDIASGDLMTAAELRRLRTKMKKAKIPTFADGYYHLWVHPNVAFDLRNDSTAPGGFMDVNRYSNPEQLLKGEIGRLEGFRISEVINAPTFSSTVTVYATIALGAIKGWGVGDLQTFRSYHIAPGGDHSDFLAQEELLGWKVMFGVAVLNNSYFYRLESAATSV